MSDFLADGLSSRDLLALLFLQERARTGAGSWGDFLEGFGPRLHSLGEDLRREVLSAHLMAVEDTDIYDDTALAALLEKYRPEHGELVTALAADTRFT